MSTQPRPEDRQQDQHGTLYTDAAYRRDKARVGRIVSDWVRRLWLGYWDVDVLYVREYLYASEEERRQDLHVFADCTARWEYRSASIRVSMLDAADMTDGELEVALVHELVHCLVNQMREPGIKNEEHVVVGLQRALCTAFAEGRAAGRREAKKETRHARAKTSRRRPTGRGRKGR